MIEISQGRIDNPFFNRERLSEIPLLHPTAVVRRSRMGAWTYLGAHCLMLDSDFDDYSYTGELVDIYNAEVGKFCNIAARVRINPTNHPMWRASLHHLTYRSHCYGMGQDDLEIFSWRQTNRITIGPDVWIGHGAILLPGINVGAGAVIGAGAVVTKDVPPYTIVGGLPARIIRRRVDPEVEQALTRIAWWNWSHEQIKDALADFRKLDARGFALKYDR
jgi:phosphonate metabolism protein (transferase hexapeptide repeat family)